MATSKPTPRRPGIANGKKDLLIRIPLSQWEHLKALRDAGRYDTVSAGIREAIRLYLDSHGLR